MTRITGWMLLAFLLTAPFPSAAHAQTYTAASCNRDDVNAVINGPTHTAVDGDTIRIPSGTCSWSSGITVPTGTGITITGTGTPTSDPTTVGPSASCTGTTLTLTGATAFRATPMYGNATTRFSCLRLTYGSGASIGVSVLGTCTANGCPNLRVDNVTFTGWTGHANANISYAVNVTGDVFGVFDHNSLIGTGGYLQLLAFSHAAYLGVGAWGDNAWANPESYGSANFIFLENNSFVTSSGTEANEGSAGGLSDEGGGRLVARFNTFTSMDTQNYAIGWHGTETGGRMRSPRAFEFYGNTFTNAAWGDTVILARGATGLAWGNTIDLSATGFNAFINLTTYRVAGAIGGWGACDGASPYDATDGTTYYSGTVSSYNSGVITVSGSPGWSTNQWVAYGAPYSVHDVTQSNGAELTANGSNTLTFGLTGGGPGAWGPDPGDSIQIRRATACIDQAGGRGAGFLYSGNPPQSTPSSQVLSPLYVWANTFIGRYPRIESDASGINTNTGRVIRSRDYYGENTNQAIQSSSTTPFDGTTTVGIGHGILANRPTSCRAGVGYFATDEGSWNSSGNGFGQGQFYVCTAANTWSLSYVPFTYPHPLITRAPMPPTGIRVIRD